MSDSEGGDVWSVDGVRGGELCCRHNLEEKRPKTLQHENYQTERTRRTMSKDKFLRVYKSIFLTLKKYLKVSDVNRDEFSE